MKILEEGSGWSIEQRCTGRGKGDGGCNSLLLVEVDDICEHTSTDYLGDSSSYYTFCCPVCGVETVIDDKLIPYSVAMRAKPKSLSLKRLKGFKYV